MYSTEELEKIYDERYAAGEEATNKREIELYQKLKSILLPKRFVDGEVVQLDLGCGRGHKTIGFSAGFKKVVAIDLSANVIKHCEKFYGGQKNIEFVAGDATKVNGKFNLITAFGFSLFNTDDNEDFIKTFDLFVSNNLKQDENSIFIIGSFTDFSGKGRESWYLHTMQDLDYIQQEIEKRGMKVNIIFPHRLRKNYLGWGFYNFIAELGKLIKKRKRVFFIVVEHG